MEMQKEFFCLLNPHEQEKLLNERCVMNWVNIPRLYKAIKCTWTFNFFHYACTCYNLYIQKSWCVNWTLLFFCTPFFDRNAFETSTITRPIILRRCIITNASFAFTHIPRIGVLRMHKLTPHCEIPGTVKRLWLVIWWNVFRPDTTEMVDWALITNYLPTYAIHQK